MATLIPTFPEEFDAALSERILDALAERVAQCVLARLAEQDVEAMPEAHDTAASSGE